MIEYRIASERLLALLPLLKFDVRLLIFFALNITRDLNKLLILHNFDVT